VNVGSGITATLTAALESVAALAGVPVRVLHRIAQPGDVEATWADLSKARHLLSYQPQVTLTEGLRQQWEWLVVREHQATLVPAEAVR
jgi:UDP-glucose 4-epimerase